MSLDLQLTNGDLDEGELICFTNDGWMKLIEVGYFDIPHAATTFNCEGPIQYPAIDLRIFRQKVIDLFSTGYLYALPNRQKIIGQLASYNYLVNMQG